MHLPFITESLVNSLSKNLNKCYLGDIVDYLHFRITSCILLIFYCWIIITTHNNNHVLCTGGKMHDITVTNNMKYVTDYCAIHATSYNEFGKPINMEKNIINYYQWVPLILALKAISFYLPYHIWKAFNNSSGISLQTLTQDIQKIKMLKEPPQIVQKTSETTKISKYQSIISQTSYYIMTYLKYQKKRRERGKTLIHSGYTLTFSYYLLKISFILINFLNFLFIFKIYNPNGEITFENLMWVPKLLREMSNNAETSRFPTVVLCPVNFYSINSYEPDQETVQCLLKNNIIYEKIFIFLWFWYLFLMCLSFISLCYWVFSISINYSYNILYNIKINKNIEKRFILDFIKHDGKILFKFLTKYIGEILIQEMIENIYNDYINQELYINTEKNKNKDTEITQSLELLPV